MAEARKGSYKFGSKVDKARKNRQDVSIALRKTAREEQMLKRRNICMGKTVSIILVVQSLFSEDVHTSPVKEQNIQTRPNDYILSLEEIIAGVNSLDEEKNYEATQSARKMLSRERNPPIDDIVGVSYPSFLGIWY